MLMRGGLCATLRRSDKPVERITQGFIKQFVTLNLSSLKFKMRTFAK